MDVNRAVIFANGSLADLEALRVQLRPDDFRIAADGGLHHLRALGLSPHLLIGDLDSIDPADRAALEARGAQVIAHPAEKDQTDLELALLHAHARGAEEILVAGALGGRLDQTLANLALLTLPELVSRRVTLTDGQTDVRLVRDTLHLHGRPGDRVSLLPLGQTAHGVRTAGLRYPLHGEALEPSRSRGISNEMLGETAAVSLDSGLLLCLHSRGAGAPAVEDR